MTARRGCIFIMQEQKGAQVGYEKTKDGRQDIPFINGNYGSLLELLWQMPRGAGRTDEHRKNHLYALRKGNDPFSVGEQILTDKKSTNQKDMEREEKARDSIRRAWRRD